MVSYNLDNHGSFVMGRREIGWKTDQKDEAVIGTLDETRAESYVVYHHSEKHLVKMVFT